MEKDIKKFMLNIFQRPIAYYPILAKIMGSVAGGVLLSQLLYWYSHYKGKFYISNEELMAQTMLSKREFDSAKKELKTKKFVKVVKEGMPYKTYYDFDLQALFEEIARSEPTCWNGEKLIENQEVFNSDNDVLFQQVGTQCSNKLEQGVPTGDEKVIERQEDNGGVIAYRLNNEIKYENNYNYNSWNDVKNYPSDWFDKIKTTDSDLLLKTAVWRRYPHPTRQGVKTTIRQMVMDIVCINRLRRELFPEEEKVVLQIQNDLNEGKLTFEKFAEAYRNWEKSGIPRIGWFVKALYNNLNDIDELQKQLKAVFEKMNNEPDAKKRLEIYYNEYKPLEEKLKQKSK